MQVYSRKRGFWGAGLIFLLLASLLVEAPPALAALRLVVNSTADAVDAKPGDGVCRTSAGKCTLRAAVQEANARSGADTIQVPAGAFALALAPRNDNLVSSGDLDITGPLTIIGAGSQLTIVDGGAAPAGAPPERRGLDRLFEIHPGAGNVTIAGMTLREGYSAESGGAVHFASPGTLRLTDVRVLDSYAAKYGGGVNNAAGGRVELAGSTLSGNGALEGGSAINNAAGGSVAVLAGSLVTGNPGAYPLAGGAIHNQGTNGAAGTISVVESSVSANASSRSGAAINNAGRGQIVVERSTISGNSAAGAGGGIYSAGGSVTISASRIADNVAASGGGIYSDLEGDLRLADVEVANNRAAAEGGGVSSQSKASLRVTRGSFTGNSAGGDGGGLHADGDGPADIAGATFEHNRAGGDGGAIAIHSAGPVVVADSVVRNNTGEGEGGGIHNGASGASTISDTRVEGNAAVRGGGLANTADGTLVVLRTRFSANTARLAGPDGGLGGGIYSAADGPASIEASSITGNSAQAAGGGVYHAADAELQLVNVTVSGNTAADAGGGIAHGTGDALRAVNATIWRNAAPAGGAISTGGSGDGAPDAAVILRNTIVGGSALGGSCDGAVTSEGGNLDSGGACFLAGPRDRSSVVSPVADALADNGGPTPTHALGAGSPAVDAGVAPCPTHDQRGVARPQHGPCDSGAVELEVAAQPGAPAPAVATIDAMPAATTTSTSATFAFSASVAGATFACALDGAAFTACASPVTYAGLAVGPHTFAVRAADAAGNVGPSPATYAWTVEGPPPACAVEVSATASADAWLEQNGPSSNKGSDSILKVKAQGPSDNFRALVRFTLPSGVPAGCYVQSATLRLYAASATTGRALQALRATGAWSEGAVTWGNQPATDGAAATVSAASGFVEWEVRAQAQAAYDAGAGYAFLIRDAVEGGSGGEQQFHSREKGEHPPLLVVRFGAAPPPPAVAEHTPDEVLIKLRSAADLAAVAQRFGLAPTPRDQFGARPIYLMAIADGAHPLEKAAALAADSRVLIAEANYVGQTPEGIGRSSWAGGRSSWAGGGGAGDYTGQWAPGAMRLAEAHAVSRGAGVTVAVLDTGVDPAHGALAGRLAPGFDFVAMDADPSEEGSLEDAAYGHGTHVAGLIALAAPDATIMPVRMLQADGSGNLWVTLEALQYAVNPDGDLRTTGDGADVINLSFSYQRQSRLLEQLVRELTCDDDLEPGENLCGATGGRGVVFVAAAGNSASSAPEYPAAEPVSGLLAVAASTAAGRLASFSNRGPWVHIAAPGEQIVSSVPGGGYGAWSGTSMAAPLVAGTAALVLAHDPGLSASDAAGQVLEAAAELDGDVPLRLDAAAALGLSR